MPLFSFIDLPAYGRVARDKEPNLCPHCLHKVSAEELTWKVSSQLQGLIPQLECVFQCVNVECSHIFVAMYKLTNIAPRSDAEGFLQSIGRLNWMFELTSTYPVIVPKTEFTAELRAVSPSFVDIYHQAEEAEARGLAQICGLGYRKAVEYLVKDYCINQTPTEETAIKDMPVAKCITKYIQDQRIEAAVKRAVWLGNDEAHYVRKWVDKDVEDLKVLIRLACNWIESSMLTAQYREEMK